MPIELDISAFEAGPQPAELVPEGILRKGEIVGVRLPGSHRIEEVFRNGIDVEPGDLVIVNTADGHEIARVVSLIRYGFREHTGGRKLVRRAEGDDLAHNERRTQRSEDAFRIAVEEIRACNLDGQMKPISLEIHYDGSGAKLYFAADDRVDFRELIRRLGGRLHTRIELRQVGPRDRAKLAGGYGLCGRELCCSSWLGHFPAVSVKQAKNQNLALDQSKITGQCGRLLCCLSYEDEQYKSAARTLPKRGFKFVHDGMNYMVISTHPLLRKVLVESAERKQHLLDGDTFDAVIMKDSIQLISQPNYLTGEARTAALARAASAVFPPEGAMHEAHHAHPPIGDIVNMEDDDTAAEHHDEARGEIPFRSPVQADSGRDSGSENDDDGEDTEAEGRRSGPASGNRLPLQNAGPGGGRPQGQGRGRRRRGRGRGGQSGGPAGQGRPQG